ncbi:hypothetical protein [Nocardiopsis halophila]|uniref:hypothetical protein n=1 Tax=Nocardiopsis halophila TaxID=141692 RepID=UPI0003487CF2|nr:hypothetical protein [Nocardiopsis halophila]
MDRYLSTAEVARLVGVSKSAITKRLSRTDDLPAPPVHVGTWPGWAVDQVPDVVEVLRGADAAREYRRLTEGMSAEELAEEAEAIAERLASVPTSGRGPGRRPRGASAGPEAEGAQG